MELLALLPADDAICAYHVTFIAANSYILKLQKFLLKTNFAALQIFGLVEKNLLYST